MNVERNILFRTYRDVTHFNLLFWLHIFESLICSLCIKKRLLFVHENKAYYDENLNLTIAISSNKYTKFVDVFICTACLCILWPISNFSIYLPYHESFFLMWNVLLLILKRWKYVNQNSLFKYQRKLVWVVYWHSLNDCEWYQKFTTVLRCGNLLDVTQRNGICLENTYVF